MKTEALALMETASFYAGVRHKRYSVQQETAPCFEIYSVYNSIDSPISRSIKSFPLLKNLRIDSS